jgi:chromosome segregation ATPase
METSIEQKESEQHELSKKIEQFNQQIAELDREISKRQASLGDQVIDEGKDLQKLGKEINALRYRQDDLKTVLNAAVAKDKFLRVGIKDHQRVLARRRLEVLKGEYEQVVSQVITALSLLLTASEEMWALAVEAGQLSQQFNLDNPAFFRAITIGDLDLQRYAHYALVKFEKVLPELFHASGVLPEAEREAPYVLRG